MAFKMKGFPRIQMNKSKGIKVDKDKSINIQGKKITGHGDPATPNVLYDEDGNARKTANIDEQELSLDKKTNSSGTYVVHQRFGNLYFKNPKK
tara:strand:+ start:477 stop:755 length:279 start_codon:yes stop_codon:yes gene_type:complete